MSFQIDLQHNASAKNVVNKQVTSLGLTPDTVVLKDKTSIIDPVFLIRANINDLVGCNYLTCATFGRCYFVNDIVSVNSTVVAIHCHVDVLTSWHTQLGNCEVIVSKNESRCNLYLNDGTFKTYADDNNAVVNFPSGFNGLSFVLAVAGS